MFALIKVIFWFNLLELFVIWLFQKGDRAIKLYCFFEVGDKTVTNGYDVTEPGSCANRTKDEHTNLGVFAVTVGFYATEPDS